MLLIDKEINKRKRDIIQQIGALQKKHQSGQCTNSNCETCRRIRELGVLLEETSKVPYVLKKGKQITKEDYFFLKHKDVPDRTIARHMKIGNTTLWLLKKEWGLVREKRGGS